MGKHGGEERKRRKEDEGWDVREGRRMEGTGS